MLLALMITILLFAVFWLVGHGLLNLLGLDLQTSDIRHAFAIAAGNAVYSTALFVLCLVRAYFAPGVLLATLALILLSFWVLRKRLSADLRQILAGFSGKAALTILFFFAITLPGFLLSGLPPFFKDTLIYHLYIPKLMIEARTFVDIPGLSNTYFPLGMELIYGIGLMVDRPEISRLLHFGYFWLLLYTTYRVGNRFGKWGGPVAAMITALTPSMQVVATWGYIDLALAFMTLVVICGFCDRRLIEQTGGPVLVGLLLGFTLWMKFLSLYLAGYGAVLLFVALTDNGFKPVPALKKLLATLVTAGVFASPFYLKNLIQTGNPVFPYFTNIFGGAGLWDPLYDKAYFHLLSNYGYGEGLLKYLLAPWYLVRFARFESIVYDGVIGWVYLPLFLLLAAGALRYKKLGVLEKVMSLAVLFGFVLWLTNSQQLRFFLPTLAFIPILGVAVVYSWVKNVRAQQVAMAALALVALSGTLEIGRYFQSIAPLPYLAQTETRGEFLTRIDPLYKTYAYINENLDPDANLFLVLVGNKRFYLDRQAFSDSIFEHYTLQKAIRESGDADKLAVWMKHQGFTHMLFDAHYIQKPLSKPELGILTQFFAQHARRLFADQDTVLVEIN